MEEIAAKLHRTIKLELDEGRAQTIDEAKEIAQRYVLQIDVGQDVLESATRQTILLTAVNAARRAFIGGVRVRLALDGGSSIRWAADEKLSQAVERYGGTNTRDLSVDHPTLIVGSVENPIGSVLLYTTWEAWSGGVVGSSPERLPEETEFPLAGILAAALAVSEAFQLVRGYPIAGRRSVGLSLWRTEQDWTTPEAFGTRPEYLPSRIWLLGLGHLGQAYAWAIGSLTYEEPARVRLMLQDDDDVEEANESTGMLCDAATIGLRKTRVVARRLEELGFETSITERRFSADTRRQPTEPGLVLVGLDDPAPRRYLENARFDAVIDAGLGAGRAYLDMLIHSFPSGISAAEAWPERPRGAQTDLLDQPAYHNLADELSKDTGLDAGAIECGVLQIAGRSAGAAFVGCVAAALVVAEAIRILEDGPRYEVVGLSLRSPQYRDAVENADPGPPFNPGFVTSAH